LGISPKDLSRPPDTGTTIRDIGSGYGDVNEIIICKASENEIDQVEREIGGFGGLKQFEVST
jgi:hypothetical protein